MLIQRAVIALTLGPLAVGLIYLGGWFLFIPASLFLGLAAYEFADLSSNMGWKISAPLVVSSVLATLFAAQWQPDLIAPIMVGVFVVITCFVLWTYEKQSSQTVLADWLVMLAIVFIVGWLGGHVLRLRGIGTADAWKWTSVAIVGTWLADSAAYVVGKFMTNRLFIGRHAFSPRLSPNKTFEGYAGSVILGTFGTWILGVLIFGLPTAPVVLLGLLVSAVSPFGDLAMSLLKREAGVKDSSNLFPGHGGALDRVDSLLWSVAFAYYLLTFFGNLIP